jgi:hypothetical protein
MRLSQKYLNGDSHQIKFYHCVLCETFVFLVVDFLPQSTRRIHEEHEDLKRTEYYLAMSFVS